MPGTVLSMQNINLVKKNYANPLEGDTKPPEGDNSMKFVHIFQSALLLSVICQFSLSLLSNVKG